MLLQARLEAAAACPRARDLHGPTAPIDERKAVNQGRARADIAAIGNGLTEIELGLQGRWK